MAIKPLYLFSVLLLNVLAVVVTSSARSTGVVKLTELRDELERPVYSWMISQDEQDRLSDLLQHDFYEVGVAGTYVTAPPQICTHCGKETEFIDWVYTALARGVHSPEFIVEAHQDGRTPKGVHHDVYCSRCGHLTHFRDHSGNEGGALYIAHATPYDRSTRTFIKREAEPEPEVVPTLEKKAENAAAGWCQRCAPGNWLIKREQGSEVTKNMEEAPAAWCQRCAPGNWLIKRVELALEHLEKKAEDVQAGWCQRCAPGNWLIKRKEELVKKAEDAAWCQRCTAGNWLIKREEDVAGVEREEKVVKKSEDAAWCQRCTAGNWLIKREIDE